MTYATREDMQARFRLVELVELTNPNDLNEQNINGAAMEVALLDASAEVDALLSARFTTPIASPPPVLKTVTCDIARYRLYAGKASEEVDNRYKNATKLLESIADGDIDLGAGSPTAGSAPAVAVSSGPIFTAGMIE